MMGLRWWLLLLFYLCFMFAGAYVFIQLESGTEEDRWKSLQDLRNSVLEFIADLPSNKTRTTAGDLFARIGDFSGINFVNTAAQDTRLWTGWNSFFFTFTLVTTIGYGHMYPNTPGGRLFTIAYGLIGVPLNGILFTLLGDYFTKKLLSRHRRSKEMDYEDHLAIFADFIVYLLPGFFVFIVFPACVFVFTEGWTFEQGFYYSFVSLTTIGFGDLVAGHPKYSGSLWWLYRLFIFVWIVFGLGYLLMIINFVQKALKSKRIKSKLRGVIKKNSSKVGRELAHLKHILNMIGATKQASKEIMLLSCDFTINSELNKNPDKSSEKEEIADSSYGDQDDQSSSAVGVDQMKVFFEIAEDILEKRNRPSHSVSYLQSTVSEVIKEDDPEADFVEESSHDQKMANALPILRKLQRFSFRNSVAFPIGRTLSIQSARSHPEVNFLGRDPKEENIDSLEDLLNAVESRLVRQTPSLSQLEDPNGKYFPFNVMSERRKRERRWTTSEANPFEYVVSDEPSTSNS